MFEVKFSAEQLRSMSLNMQ